MMASNLFLLLLLCLGIVTASPRARADPHADPAAAPAPTPIATEAQLDAALAALTQGPASAFAPGYVSIIQNISPAASPTNLAEAATRLSSVYAARPSNVFGTAADILLSGLAGGNFTQNSNLEAFGPCNSVNNQNYVYAYPPVYPRKSSSDAPYDISENQLRSAIYIPKTFQYGAKPPLLFLPGTGVEACENFLPNLGKLFTGVSYADPVYVNIPDNMLQDLQNSAEYVAYAINYISRISQNRNVSVITWSAGSVAAQWAHKYWPSTRSVTSDVINVSGDLHGTIFVPIVCPPGIPCPPSVLQQNYNSTFIRTLRNKGGDSAYVPTTSIWSIFDEIVEPQQLPFASAMVGDARNVGVTNAQIQNICPPGTPAGGPSFGHESALYSSITYALAKDALTNSGPGSVARSINPATVCPQYAAPGLTLADIFATEFLIPLATFNLEAYPKKVLVEPAIKAYAAGDTPA